MDVDYPEFRAEDESGLTVLREGAIVCFFMQKSHSDLGPLIVPVLDLYRAVAGPLALNWFTNPDGELRKLTPQQWSRLADSLRDHPPQSGCLIELSELNDAVSGFHFEYRGRWLGHPLFANWPDAVSFVSCWFPSEFVAAGPKRMRDFAVAVAHELPFDSGYASLGFNYVPAIGEEAAFQAIRGLCYRFPGIDVHLHTYTSFNLGTRIPGAYWLTFLGPAMAGELGGAAGLRGALNDPAIEVAEIGTERLLVTLGERPEPGNTHGQQFLPRYRTLARVVEPHLHHRALAFPGFSEDDMERWENRFLRPMPEM